MHKIHNFFLLLIVIRNQQKPLNVSFSTLEQWTDGTPNFFLEEP